jgi:MFS family permease
MQSPDASGPSDIAADGRPAALLPLRQLVQISLYWFGINAIWGAVDGVVLQERVPHLVDPGTGGTALAAIKVVAVVMAIVVQPTIGTISDYTMSRWGRRKPYIAIGASLDVLFLLGLASAQTFLAVMAFVVLLQFSSNFAQGPFQGYIPDLVGAKQVAIASALVGIMSILGNVGGTIIASLGLLVTPPDFRIPLIAVGLIEFLTMVGTVLWVREGRVAKDRAGRSWPSVAAEAWGTDILREHSYVWLVASRLFFLTGVSMITALSLLYLGRSMSLAGAEKGTWVTISSILVAASIVITAWPAAKLSDRLGRKAVIYGACGFGAVGMGLLAIAPGLAVAEVGIICVGIGAGAFLSVDWALMTDIIPKASSGRYMGMSNVATASAGAFALIIGGPVIDLVGGKEQSGAGPRAALAIGVGLFLIAALLLRQVDERRREDADELIVVPVAAEAAT